jgi:hypothetical protein
MAELLEANKIFYTPYEPKLKNRYIFEIGGIPAFTIKTAQRPQITFDEVTLEHMNITKYVKGKGRWQPITITLYDPIVPSGTQAAIEWFRLHYESVTGRQGFADFYKKDVVINVLGPVGDKVEEFTLKGAFITNLTPSALDWAEEGFSTVELTLSYDYAILQF